MTQSLRSEFGSNVVRLCPKERSANDAGPTTAESIEFEVLDALPPFDDNAILRGYSKANQSLTVKNVG